MNPMLLDAGFTSTRFDGRAPLLQPPRDRSPAMRSDARARALRPAPAPPECPSGPEAALSPAFAALFHAIEALRTDARPIALQLVGADASCRTAAIASGLARTAREAIDPGPPGAARPGPVLLVDAVAAPRRPQTPDLLSCLRRGGDLAEAAVPAGEGGIEAAVFARTRALAGPEAARLIDAIRARFALALLDCGAVGDGGAMPPLARHCDGTLLVCRAGRTRLAAIEAARFAIERAGGRVLGAVVQEDGAGLPRWLSGRR